MLAVDSNYRKRGIGNILRNTSFEIVQGFFFFILFFKEDKLMKSFFFFFRFCIFIFING